MPTYSDDEEKRQQPTFSRPPVKTTMSAEEFGMSSPPQPQAAPQTMTAEQFGGMPAADPGQPVPDKSMTAKQFGREPVERNIVGDVASNIARGGADAMELTGYALKTAGAEKVGDWIVDKTKDAKENIDFLQPDESEQAGEGFVKRGVMGGLRSLPPSLASAAVGFGAGATVGGPVGGFIGAAAGALGLFGLGIYGQEKEAALEKGLSEAEAHQHALEQAAVEGGIEAIATPIELLTAGFGRAATTPLKQSIKELVKTPAKKLLKNYLKTMGVETSTEMLQSGLGTKLAQAHGMAEGDVGEAIIESIIPAMTMSLFFGVAGHAYTAKQQHTMRKALADGEYDGNVRAGTANTVYNELAKDDPELAKLWYERAQEAITNRQPIDIDEKFAEYAGKKTKEEKEAGITADNLPDPDSVADFDEEPQAPEQPAPENPSSGTISRMVDKAPVVQEEAPVVPEQPATVATSATVVQEEETADPLAEGTAAAQSVDSSLQYQGMDSMGLHHFRNPQGESFAAESIDPADIKARWEKSQEAFRNVEQAQTEVDSSGDMAGGQGTDALPASPEKPGAQSPDGVPGQPDSTKPEAPVDVRTAGQTEGEKVTPGAETDGGEVLSGKDEEFDPLKIIQEGTGQQPAAEENVTNPKSQRRIARLRENIKALEADVKDWSSRVYTKTDMGYEKKDMYGQESGTDSYTNANERRRKRTIRGFEQSIAEQQAEIDKIVKEDGVQADAVGYEPIMAETDTGTYRTRKQAQAAIDQVGQTENYEVVSAKGHNVGPSGFVGMPKYSLKKADGSRPGPAKSTIEQAFNGQEVTENKDGSFTVKTQGGATIRVKNNAVIITGTGQRAAGSFQRIDSAGIMQLSRMADDFTVDHEMFHAAEEMALTKEEIQTLANMYGDVEQRADAYASWDGVTDIPLFQKIKEFFQKIGKALGLKVDTTAADARKIFEDVKSGEVWSRSVTDPAGTLSVNYSVRSLPDTEKRLLEWNKKNKIVSPAKMKRYIKDLQSVSAMILGGPASLNYVPTKDIYKALKDNSDKHYKYSLDFSTICKKRLELAATIEAVQLKLGRGLTPQEISDTRMHMKKLQQAGLDIEVSCGACYVDSARIKIGLAVERFVRLFPGYKQHKENLLYQQGLDKLKRDNPDVFKEFSKYIAPQNIKASESRTDYDSEVLTLSQNDVDLFNKRSGLRWQSWSDFEVPHLIDAMQAVVDHQARGLKAHTYTKVPLMAELLGRTGIMMNMSLIPKGNGMNKDGSLNFDPIEGMPYETAKKLRKQFSDTVGTIAIGVTDENILAMMKDPDIDYIIPYHKSGLPKIIANREGMEEWKDYTSVQTNKVVNSTKFKKSEFKKIDDFNDWDSSLAWWNPKNTGDQNAQAYIDKCLEVGVEPKFNQFRKTPGYWKMLIDRKMFNNDGTPIIQQPVAPIYDMKLVEETISGYSAPRSEADAKIVDTLAGQFPKELSSEQVKTGSHATKSKHEKMLKTPASKLKPREKKTITDVRKKIIDGVKAEELRAIGTAKGLLSKDHAKGLEYVFDLHKAVQMYPEDYKKLQALYNKAGGRFDFSNPAADADVSESLIRATPGTGGVAEGTLGEVLDDAAANAPNRLTKTLANLLQGFIKGEKRNIQVIIDASATSPNYNPGTNTITINNMADYETAVHEIVHAVTVNEMEKNPKLKARVTRLMNRVGRAAIAEGIFTEQEMAAIKEAKTSRGFMNKFPQGTLTGRQHIAYAFVNEKEFLSQTFSSLPFQGLLERTRVRDKGSLKSAWDAFLDIVLEGLGLRLNNKNAFSEALKLTTELASSKLDGAIEIGTIKQGDISMALRTKPAPKKTQKAYKLFRKIGDKAYALFIGRALPLEQGKWYDAESPKMQDMEKLAPNKTYLIDKNGKAAPQEFSNKKQSPSKKLINEASVKEQRYVYIGTYKDGTKSYYNWGINGSGGVSVFAMRPGWHSTNVPSARHIGAQGKSKKVEYRRADEFWAEIEMSADQDYQEEAASRPGGDIQEKIPEDGFYSFQTNTNAEKAQDWFIGGSIKINRWLTEKEAAEISKTEGFQEDLPKKSKLSVTKATGQPGSLEKDLEKSLGKRGLRNLLKKGTVEILETQEEAWKIAGINSRSQQAKYGKLQGFSSGRKIYLVRDGIGKGQAFPVLKHELGVHLHKLALKDKDFAAIKDMIKSRQKERGRTGKAIRAAMLRVPKATEQDVYWEEVMAYMVEMHPDHSIVKRIMDKVKAILAKMGVNINTLTVDDLNDLAVAAVRREALGEKRMDKVMYSQDISGYKNWSRGYDEISGAEISDAKPGQGYVFKVYHGTTHDFDTFDPSQTGNKEGQFGAVNYFTSDTGDAGMNYAGEGPDLTNRIDALTEQLENLDPDEIADQLGIDFDLAEAAQGNEEALRQLATEKLSGGSPKTLDVFVRLDNPVYVNGDTKTWIENLDNEQYREDATAEVLDENDATEEDIDEYEDEIQERIYEMAQYDEPRILVALRDAINEFETDANADEIYSTLNIDDIEITADALDKALRESDQLSYVEDYNATIETGRLISSHIIGQVFKNLGYDGIVLQNANKRFPGMSMGSETSHIHVFEENPSKIKSATDNSGEFNEWSGNIFKSATAPIWTSRLQEMITTKGPKAAPADQWLKSIESWKKKGTMPVAVQEELEWSGLEEYLEDFEGDKITKAEIDSFLASNGVKVGEVTLEGGNEYEGDWADATSEEILAAYMEMSGQTEEEVQWVTEGDMIGELNMQFLDDPAVEENQKPKGTVHDTYQLPGGENYKEMLITMPEKVEAEKVEEGYGVYDREGYVEGHYDYWNEAKDAASKIGGTWEPLSQEADDAYKASKRSGRYNHPHWEGTDNVLTHVRFNERIDKDGNKILFLEEVQSDWHQEGRGEGYKVKKLTVESVENIGKNRWEVFLSDKDSVEVNASSEEGARRAALAEIARFGEDTEGVPDAPFKKSWPLLAMKRMIRYAAENGFDRIAWTTGQQQFDRYSSGSPEDQAKRLKGMTKFYEMMLPSQVDKFIKKFGAKTGTVEIARTNGTPDSYEKWLNEQGMEIADVMEDPATEEQFDKAYDEYVETFETQGQPGFDITDEMKASVLGQGMPLFSIAPIPGQSRIIALAKKFLSEEQIEKAVTYLWDKDTVFKRVQKEIGQQDENKDYNLIRRLLGKKISDETVRFEQDRLKPLIEEIAAGKINFEDVDQLAWAEHAPERNKQMQRVNARRYIDNFMAYMTGKEKEPFLDKLMDIQTEFVMDKQTRNDRRDNYVQLMNDFAKNVRKTERQVRKEIADLQRKYDARTFTTEEIMKGTRDRAERKIENMTKRLDARLAIGSRWEDVSERLSGMTNKEAQDIMDKWKADSRYPAIRSAVDKLRAIGAESLELNYLAGEYTDEEYDAIKNTYSKHVPLYREDMEEAGKTSTGRSGHGPLSKPIKIASGSTRNVVDVFAHVIDRYQAAINRKHKLAADKILYDMVKENPDADRWSIAVPEKKPFLDVQGNVRFYQDNFAEEANQIRIKVDGKPMLIEVPKDNKSMRRWMDALKREPAQLGPMLKASGKITRFLAQLNTSFSPEFIISNFGRDIQTASVNMEDTAAKGMQKKVIGNVSKAIKGIYLQERGRASGDWGKWYLDFAKHGGKIGWMQGYENVEELAENLEKELEYAEGKRPVRGKLRKVGEFIGAMNTSVENGVRLATYRALVESGVTKAKAAHTAANLTVDFTRSGTINPALNSLYMFANAGIQGNIRMLKALGNKKVQKIAGGIFGFGMTAGLVAAFIGGDDEDGESYYDKIKRTNPDLFERNMIFMIPGTKGRYIKIPMPYGYNVIYVAGVEASDMMRGKNPVQAMSHIGSAMMNTFNPIGSATLLQTIMPTVGDPVAQVFENKSWSGQDLMPGANPFGIPTPDSERYWKSVNPIAKWAAQAVNKLTFGDKYEPGFIDVSPETIEMMIETYTGSLGRFTKDVFSIPARAVIDGELPISKTPFLRKLTGRMSDYTDSQLFRENSEKIDIFTKRYKEATPSQLAVMRNQPEAKMMGYTKAMDKQLRLMKKNKNFYEEQGQQEKADSMNDRMNELYLKYNTRFNKLMK